MFAHIAVKLRPSRTHAYAFKLEILFHYKIGVLSRSLLTFSLFHLSVSLLLTHFVTRSFISLPMAKTHAKNKTTNPGAPVMTEAAKIKAGIPVKPCPKKQTQANQIRELEARLAAFKRPDEVTTIVSKEPLVSRTSSHTIH